MGHGQPQRFGHHLAGGSRPQELAAPARRGAGPAGQLGGFFQADQPVGKARADRLHLAGVLAFLGQQGHPARHDHPRQLVLGGDGDHHRRQALVAGGHAHHPAPRGQRAHQAAQHHGGVVAVRQAVHHAGGALGAPVARVADVAGEGRRPQAGEFLGSGLHQPAHLPMPGVVAQGDGRAVRGADPAQRAQDQEFFRQQARRLPAHGGILGQPEDLAAGGAAQQIGVQRQAALRPGGVGRHLVNGRVGRIERQGFEGVFHNDKL